jgi:hypothetical protein
MTSAHEAMQRLDELAQELDKWSKALHQTERELEPVEAKYEQYVADFEIGCWRRHEDDGAKLPPEKLRIKMAHRAMDPGLYGSYVGLLARRKRLEKRIASLKTIADSQRSILSALQTEAEAMR